MQRTEALLRPYQQQYENLVVSEDVLLGRIISRGLKTACPETSKAFDALYKYARILDDATDLDGDLYEVIQILKRERQALYSTGDTALYRTYVEPSLHVFNTKQQRLIKKHLARIVTGLMLDAGIRATGEPLSERMLIVRNFLDLWPEIAVACMLVTGKDPTPTKNTVGLMNAWGNYDNLRDLPEDLPHGLVLISKEDLAADDIQFQSGQQIPVHALQQHYLKKRKVVSKNLVKYAKDLFRWNVPYWVSVPGYIYFTSRIIKLIPKLDIEPFVYQPPKRKIAKTA
ncbi:MAG TPA: hypothetical protein VJ246_02480 [Patescibacteria group bacterium]|nr:hypothetical protein [Patescibacteria group bacterium]